MDHGLAALTATFPALPAPLLRLDLSANQLGSSALQPLLSDVNREKSEDKRGGYYNVSPQA